jgi:hypothetical protein
VFRAFADVSPDAGPSAVSDEVQGPRRGRRCRRLLVLGCRSWGRRWRQFGLGVLAGAGLVDPDGPAKTGYGNNWVIAAVVVRLPMVGRPVAIPVLAKLVIKDTSSALRLWLARRMTGMLAGALPRRPSASWPTRPTPTSVTCLWPSVFGTRPVTAVLIRDRSAAGYDLALITTDTAATAAQVIERYASRWSIEVAIEDARQVFGTGQARNRTAAAVERTVPFQLACQAITACWYATAGHDPADVAEHRARAPCYTTKARVGILLRAYTKYIVGSAAGLMAPTVASWAH